MTEASPTFSVGANASHDDALLCYGESDEDEYEDEGGFEADDDAPTQQEYPNSTTTSSDPTVVDVDYGGDNGANNDGDGNDDYTDDDDDDHRVEALDGVAISSSPVSKRALPPGSTTPATLNRRLQRRH